MTSTRELTTFFAALWLAVGVAVGGGYAASLLLGMQADHPNTYVFRFLIYALWIPFVPLVVRLARRFAPVRGRRTRALLVHLGCGTILSIVTLLLHRMIFCGGFNAPYWTCVCYLRLEPWFVQWMAGDAFLYGATVSGIWLLDAVELVRRRDVLLATRERELAAAELQLVSSQLPPDYLTSLFGAISERLHRDRPAAEAMITSVADFLRLSVNAIRATELTLRDDLALVAAWAQLETTRRESLVSVVADVDEAWQATPIAAPLLQPLVAKLAAGDAVLVCIAAQLRDGALALRVDCSNDTTSEILLPLEAVP